MKETICDCCKRHPSIGFFVMDADGIHPPSTVRREDGFQPIKTVDLCECRLRACGGAVMIASWMPDWLGWIVLITGGLILLAVWSWRTK